ncbi:disabled homolog 2-like isoform X2 [Anneissia japonica]|uniref:disabled homolog 2-like isoform X2 n=1 Tax=Anneissia japonica TaxID=1529436 RepID=UPI001425770E|nr:disabled homolog 2-like isoform X2 [Anneissia japonica]
MMAQKNKKEGVERFQGIGIDFKAKMIGIEKVDDARGDRMCQEAMMKLKAMVKASGEHKQRVNINISIEGLKIIDEKTGCINHHHEVHKISFISRDPADNRAFGYIHGDANNHQFFGIKTEKAAENVVLALKDLFQVVLELKTKQIEDQKIAAQQTTLHLKPSYDDTLYEVPIGQEKAAVSENSVAVSEAPSATSETPEDVNALYAVPNKGHTPESSNLLDLAAEVKTLQLGIHDMDQFSFDPVQEGSATQIQSPNSSGTKSPNPFQVSNSWNTFDSTNSQQSKPTTNFGTAFGDPFVVPTSTPQTNSANLFAEFSDTFKPPTNTAAPAANPFGNNFSNTSFGAPAANAFGAPNQFGAPASNAFGGAAFGAPASNTFQANFSTPSEAPAMQKPADPFGDPFDIGGPPSGDSSQGVIGQPLAPTAVPTTNESASKPDPFGDLGLISSSSSKSGKDMFANFQMAKPGEVAMPDIMPAGMPDRPPPAVPLSTGTTASTKPTLTTSDGVTLFDDSPFGL